jgi:hypothetical protein
MGSFSDELEHDRGVDRAGRFEGLPRPLNGVQKSLLLPNKRMSQTDQPDPPHMTILTSITS